MGDKYVDLRVHGRLFPTWVLANFKEFKLPETIKKGEDACKEHTKITEYRKYQLFLSKFLNYNSPYHSILIYHGLGSGKTVTSINIYNTLFNYNPDWNVFILIKAALQYDPWLRDIKKWLDKDKYDIRYGNIIFIHYDSPFADKEFLEAVKKSSTSKKNIYIIDEIHNFIRNVYSNITSKQGKRAQVIYDYIIRDKHENEGVRIVLLSGTPAINNPFELALLFNLLRYNIFPRSEATFNNIFVSNNKTMNEARKNTFQRRIMGLVSYYIGATPDYYAKKQTTYINIKMSEHQDKVYGFFEELENKLTRFSKHKGSGTYKSYTRQACNFVFPEISSNINGEGRPRPRKFRLSDRQAEMLLEGRKTLKDEKGGHFLNIKKYIESLNKYMEEFVNYLNDANNSDINDGHQITKDIENYTTQFNYDIDKFMATKKSKVFTILNDSSAKMINIILNIFKTKGLVLVYSNYVLMEGLDIFKIYLKWFGFHNYMSSEPSSEGFSYIEYHGGIDKKDRQISLEIFNKPENKYGKIIKIILISPAGSEGISIHNIRQIHIMEPFWNETRITQMIGRGIRQCSHKDLPLDERIVDIYRYKSIRKSNIETADQSIEESALEKEKLIQTFLTAMKEVAIDCELNKEHNMIDDSYQCFKFDEQSLFDKKIAPAYKQDLLDDIKIDNGTNSLNSHIIKVKVFKIKAVSKIGNNKYSKPNEYWFNPNTGVIYDIDLKYPIGNLEIDGNGLFTKLDQHTYVINYIIPIPII